MPQAFRPPRQTPAQAGAMQQIISEAAINSTKAKAWVVNYMGNSTLRERLHPSLKQLNLTNEELFERFTWEFARLPIIHNAPLSYEDKATIVPVILA
jgi:hypothetical protein